MAKPTQQIRHTNHRHTKKETNQIMIRSINKTNIAENNDQKNNNNPNFSRKPIGITEPKIQNQHKRSNNRWNPLFYLKQQNINKGSSKFKKNPTNNYGNKKPEKQNLRGFKFMITKNFAPSMTHFDKRKTNQSTYNCNHNDSASLHQCIDYITHVISKNLIVFLIILFFPLILFAYALFLVNHFGIFLIGTSFFMVYGLAWGYLFNHSSKRS